MTTPMSTTKRNGTAKVAGAMASLLLGALMMFLGIASFVRAEIAEHAGRPAHPETVSREAFEEFRLNVYRRLDRIETLIEKRHEHSE